MNLAMLIRCFDADPTLLEIYGESAVKGALFCFLLTAVWWTLHRLSRRKGTQTQIGMGFQYLFASAIGLAVLAIILGVLVARQEQQEREVFRQYWRESHAPAPATLKTPTSSE